MRSVWQGTLKKQKPSRMTRDSFQSGNMIPTNRHVYLPVMKSFTLSLCTIASLKEYAPDLGERTVRITLVQDFASALATPFPLIAVFACFAMTIYFQRMNESYLISR